MATEDRTWASLRVRVTMKRGRGCLRLFEGAAVAEGQAQDWQEESGGLPSIAVEHRAQGPAALWDRGKGCWRAAALG